MLDRRSQPRNHYIHRINYTTQERIVGTFVLLAIAILMWLMFSSGKTQHIFEEQLTFYGELSTTKAVNKDTEVMIAGLSVGTVSSVEVTENNQIVLTMNILKKYHNLLRTDSKAELTSFDFAVLGKSIIEITPGSPSLPLLPDGSTIKVGEAATFKKLIDRVEPIFNSLESSINQMNAILIQIEPQQVGQTLDNIHQTSEHIKKITTQVTQGDNIINTAVYDASFEKDIRVTIKNLQNASNKMNQLLDTLNEQVAHVPDVLDKIEPLLNEANKTLKASQRIWPLSTAVDQDDKQQTLTSPEPAND